MYALSAEQPKPRFRAGKTKTPSCKRKRVLLAERGEEPMTAGGRYFIGSEVSRNKQPPLCGGAQIEAAEGSHPVPPETEKAPEWAPDSGGAGGIRTHGRLPVT